METELMLYLFYDNDYPLVLPSPYDKEEPDEHCVSLGECAGEQALNKELARAGNLLEQVQGEGLILSVYRWEDRARADGFAVRLRAETLQQMADGRCGLDYSFYISRCRSTRFLRVMSFFLLSFPQGEPARELPQEVPFLHAGVYQGQYYVLTPCMEALAAYLSHLAAKGCHLPALRIDYFSEGTAVMWYLDARDEIRSLASLCCSLELRIHPAMLLPEDDSIAPLFRYLMRSSRWRKLLIPPPEDDSGEGE